MFLWWRPKAFPDSSGHLRPIFNFFPFQKKRFFCGILFSSESPYLRAVKFNTILGLFLIYNGKLDLAILNKESNHGQNGLYYCDLTKVYHRKSAFLEMEKNWKSAGTVREGFRTPPQKHLTPFHKKIMVRSSILKKISSTKRGWVISGQHGTI